MSAGRICTRTVVTAIPDETVQLAARRMANSQVGTLVVVEPGPAKRPVGVLTDRDIAVRCVAEGLEPARTAISVVMSKPVESIDEDTPVEETLERMVRANTRRLVVRDLHGGLVGVISLDDILELLTEEASALARLLDRQSPHVPV